MVKGCLLHMACIHPVLLLQASILWPALRAICTCLAAQSVLRSASQPQQHSVKVKEGGVVLLSPGILDSIDPAVLHMK